MGMVSGEMKQKVIKRNQTDSGYKKIGSETNRMIKKLKCT